MDRGAWWATVHGVARESNMTYRVSNNTTMRTYTTAQGTLLHALWWTKGKGNPNIRGYMYAYS